MGSFGDFKVAFMNAEINKDFVFKYLSGKSSAVQKQVLDEWVRLPANEELFYAWLVEFEYQNPQYLTNLPRAIEQFYAAAEQVDTQPYGGEVMEVEPSNWTLPRWTWLAAASLIGAILLSSLIFKENILYKKYGTAYGQTQTLWLEDSSKVVLNANSSLRVPRFGFGPSTREVHLVGEASFYVTHQAQNQKFVVKTSNNLDVIVLGTEFTVYARQQKAKVVLNKGKVRLAYEAGKVRRQHTMKPGELVTLDQHNQLTQKMTEEPHKYAAWQNHRFEFEDTPLREFAELMQENYGIKVLIRDDSLANRTLVGSYRAENPEELLDIVSKIFGLTIRREGNTVVLTQ